MTFDYEYNEDLGCETINNEYKLFIFNPIIVEPDDCLELLRTRRWIFNESTIQSIKTYLRLYLPKYISSYTHPLTKVSYGNLLIGINDDGLIYGIPYQGIFPLDIIKNEIDYIFKNMLLIKKYYEPNELKYITNIEQSPYSEQEYNNRLLTMYKNEIIIKISTIKKIKFHFDTSNYEMYIHNLNLLQKQYDKYLSKKRIWEKLIFKYTNKLHEMLNDKNLRKDIITFIREKSSYQKKSFRTKYSDIYYLCEIRDYYHFMSELKSDFKYSSIKHDTIEKLKDDPTNIFYWVTKWKDSKTTTLKHIKPKSPKILSNKNYPMFLLSQVHRMIPEWCHSNPDLKLYLINIKIPGNIDKSRVIEYQDSGIWIHSYRKIESGEPTSKSFYQ